MVFWEQTPHLQNPPKKISNPRKTNTQLQIAIQELEEAIQEMRNSMKEPHPHVVPPSNVPWYQKQRVFQYYLSFMVPSACVTFGGFVWYVSTDLQKYVDSLQQRFNERIWCTTQRKFLDGVQHW